MKILFAARHPLYLRNYELALRELAQRGHSIHIAFSPIGKDVETSLADRLCADHPQITIGDLPERTGWWRPVTTATRTLVDWLRYLDPLYRDAPRLTARAARRVPGSFIALFGKPVFRRAVVRRLVSRWLPVLDRQLPTDEAMLQYVRDAKPDLVLLTPLIDFTYLQYEVLKAANDLGIPTGLCVASWDNLTNKGIVQLKPDRTFVWNEVQRRETIDLHRLPEKSVVVTGAQLFDQWFGMSPRLSREAFCAKVGGLDPGRPIILYLCSSVFICADEVGFIRRWLAMVRASGDAVLREANVLVRPHPAHAEQWRDVDLGDHRAVVWPRAGGVPIDEERAHDYFDSLHHGAVCVGLNTSAFIEAAIVGRRTMTLRVEEFAGTQDGTVHIRYLLDGGPVTLAETWDEHLAQMSAALQETREAAAALRGFVTSFVRPLGLDKPATPVLVGEIEALAAETPRPAGAWWAPAARAAYYPLAKYVIRPRYLAFEARRQNRKMNRKAKAEHGSLQKLAARWRIPRDRKSGPAVEARLSAAIGDADRTLRRIAASERPVLVGPWLSEIGYELLYWIPFITWAVDHYGIARDRLVVVSRGGARPWYADVADRYVELFDFVDPDAFRRRNESRLLELGIQKQKEIGAFDDEVVELVKRRLDTALVDVLHPALMYSGFLRYHWSERSSMQHLFAHTHHRMFTSPTPGELEARLPQDFVAVRFYFRESFTDTPDNRALVSRVLDSLSRQGNVVLLNTPFDVDEHHDVAVGGASGVMLASEFMTPQNNLEIQTRIIARSRAFVGTYGGLSYIAPHYGKPAISFHDDANILPAHVNTASSVFRDFKVPYIVLSPREMNLVQSIAGGAASSRAGRRRFVA